MSYLAVAAVLAGVVLLGSRLGAPLLGESFRRSGAEVELALDRLVLSFAAGLVVLHVALLGLSLLGIAWGVTVLGAILGLYVLATWRLARAPVTRRGLAALGRDLGWGDAVAGLAVALFAFYAIRHWIVFQDFVYHWGVKAKRFLLAGGVDLEFLNDPALWFLHRDYPTLLPELFALTGLVRGHFTERGVMVWTVLFLLGLVLAARRALSAAGVPRVALQGGTAIVALVAAGFGIGFYLGGAADWLVALALMVAVVPLTEEHPDRGHDWQVALAASLAVASKVEGAALGSILVLVHVVRRLRSGTTAAGELIRTLGRVAAPPAAVGTLWLVPVLRFDLGEAYYAGGWTWERLPAALEAMGGGLLVVEWVGVPVAALALLVAMSVEGRTRPLAVACWGQLLFLLLAYLLAPVDTGSLVASSFARLLFQLVPAVVVGGIVAFAGARAQADVSG